jgi:predicted esterase
VLNELIGVDGLEEIFLVGYSMGANQALKLAGELGDQQSGCAQGRLRDQCTP